MTKNYYEILNCNPNSSNEEIKIKFNYLAKVFNPLFNKDKDTNKEYLSILESYEVLSNPQKKFIYDLNIKK